MYKIIERSYITANTIEENDNKEVLNLEENEYYSSDNLIQTLEYFGGDRIKPEIYRKAFTELSKDNSIIIAKTYRSLKNYYNDPSVARRDGGGSFIRYYVHFCQDYILKIE